MRPGDAYRKPKSLRRSSVDMWCLGIGTENKLHQTPNWHCPIVEFVVRRMRLSLIVSKFSYLIQTEYKRRLDNVA